MYIKIYESPEGYFNLEVYPEGWDNPETTEAFTSEAALMEELDSVVHAVLYSKEKLELDFHLGGPFMKFDREKEQ